MPVVSPSMLRLEQASVNNSPGPIYQSRGVSQNFIRTLFCKASVCACVAAILSSCVYVTSQALPQPCCTRLLRTRISNKSGSIARSFRRRSSEGCCSHDLEVANVDDDGVAEVNDDDMMIISMMLMDDDATADDSLLLACSEFGGRGSHRSHEKQARLAVPAIEPEHMEYLTRTRNRTRTHTETDMLAVLREQEEKSAVPHWIPHHFERLHHRFTTG